VGQQIMASAAMNFTAVPKAASLRASSFRSGKAVSMAKPAKAAVVASQPLKVSCNLKVGSSGGFRRGEW
jgi:hypothetical protein